VDQRFSRYHSTTPLNSSKLSILATNKLLVQNRTPNSILLWKKDLKISTLSLRIKIKIDNAKKIVKINKIFFRKTLI